MKVSEINKLKVGDMVHHHQRRMVVSQKRPAYAPDIIWDEKIGARVEIPDRSIGLQFTAQNGKSIWLETRSDAKMVVNGAFTELDIDHIEALS